jgi:hypothetical protein
MINFLTPAEAERAIIPKARARTKMPTPKSPKKTGEYD